MRSKRNTSRTNPILIAFGERAGASPQWEAAIALQVMCLEGDSRAELPTRARRYDAAMKKCTGPEIAFAIDVLAVVVIIGTLADVAEMVASWRR